MSTYQVSAKKWYREMCSDYRRYFHNGASVIEVYHAVDSDIDMFTFFLNSRPLALLALNARDIAVDNHNSNKR